MAAIPPASPPMTTRREVTPATIGAMAVRTDCRHYGTRTLASGDKLERCKLGVNEETPFACPEGCVFFEPRSGMTAGWKVS